MCPESHRARRWTRWCSRLVAAAEELPKRREVEIRLLDQRSDTAKNSGGSGRREGRTACEALRVPTEDGTPPAPARLQVERAGEPLRLRLLRRSRPVPVRVHGERDVAVPELA